MSCATSEKSWPLADDLSAKKYRTRRRILDLGKVGESETPSDEKPKLLHPLCTPIGTHHTRAIAESQ
jgi:hypothetical protein